MRRGISDALAEDLCGIAEAAGCLSFAMVALRSAQFAFARNALNQFVVLTSDSVANFTARLTKHRKHHVRPARFLSASKVTVCPKYPSEKLGLVRVLDGYDLLSSAMALRSACARLASAAASAAAVAFLGSPVWSHCRRLSGTWRHGEPWHCTGSSPRPGHTRRSDVRV